MDRYSSLDDADADVDAGNGLAVDAALEAIVIDNMLCDYCYCCCCYCTVTGDVTVQSIVLIILCHSI